MSRSALRTRGGIVFAIALWAAAPLEAQEEHREINPVEHANSCKGHEDTCRIAEGVLAAAEKKVPAIGIATNVAGAAMVAGEEGAPAQFEFGGKAAGLIKSGVETGKDVLTSGLGQRLTGISATEAAAMEESAAIGGKVLGPVAEVAAFCAEALRAVESCKQGEYLDGLTHATTAVAGATANSFCPGMGSTCANAAIGIGNVWMDMPDPELDAARRNTEALIREHDEVEQQAAADKTSTEAQVAEYRRTGGTVVERGVGDAISAAMPESSKSAGAGFIPVGAPSSPGIDDLVASAVDETVASTPTRVRGSETSSRLAEHGEQAFETMRAASAQAGAAVSSMLSQQMQSSQQSYGMQSPVQAESSSSVNAQNCALARQQEGANTQYITDNSAINDSGHRQAVAAAERVQRSTVSWISSNCH